MEDIKRAIESAIEDEKAAQENYKQLAENTDDPQAKAMFEQMAKDEANHEKLLRSRLEAISKLSDS